MTRDTEDALLAYVERLSRGGADDSPIRLHASVAGGHLGMDAYAFGADARALADDVEAASAM